MAMMVVMRVVRCLGARRRAVPGGVVPSADRLRCLPGGLHCSGSFGALGFVATLARLLSDVRDVSTALAITGNGKGSDDEAGGGFAVHKRRSQRLWTFNMPSACCWRSSPRPVQDVGTLEAIQAGEQTGLSAEST